MYVGGSLTQFFGDKPQAVTRETAHRMAGKAGKRMTEVAAMNTPVRTGHLRESWRTKETVGGDGVYESGTETDVIYGPYVEYGTGLWGPSHSKYLIEPKTPGGVLHWFDTKTGHEVFARRVLHPGSPGNHMVAIAAAMVEHEAGAGLFRVELREWAEGCAEAAR